MVYKVVKKIWMVYLWSSKNIYITYLGNKINIFDYQIDVHDYITILNLFSLRRFAKDFIVGKDGIKISFDGKNNFFISKGLDKNDRVLLELLNQGLKDGAYFVDEEHVSTHTPTLSIRKNN